MLAELRTEREGFERVIVTLQPLASGRGRRRPSASLEGSSEAARQAAREQEQTEGGLKTAVGAEAPGLTLFTHVLTVLQGPGSPSELPLTRADFVRRDRSRYRQ